MKKYLRDSSRLQPDPSGLTASERALKKEMHQISLKAYAKKITMYKNSKKKRIKRVNKKIVERDKRLERYSDALEYDLPKSEIWFRELYSKESFNKVFKEKHFTDQFNRPFGPYIPDIHNKGYRYVIEIDGSFHDLESQKRKDFHKDYYFNKREYLMIRVKAYDVESYKSAIDKIQARIIEVNESEALKRKR